MDDLTGEDDPFEHEAAPPRIPTAEELHAIEVMKSIEGSFRRMTDKIIALYRGFDKTGRVKIKVQMKELYELMLQMGERVGISRFAMDSLPGG